MTKATRFETLRLERLLPASPDRLFRAWTDPVEMKQWWGPKGVRCLSVDIDLRVGGRYRIANEMPDGSVLWISGQFEVIEEPELLVYTWVVETDNPTTERVRVRFRAQGHETEIAITHERISTKALKGQHRDGWAGCLDGLVAYLGGIRGGKPGI